MSDDPTMNRSAFLRRGFAYLLGKAVEGIEAIEQSVVKRYFRPPGALSETEFLSTCERCNACIEACTPGILSALPPEAGLAAGTPMLRPETGPCQLCPELPCIHACPSGALRPIPLERVRIGIARLEPDRCLAHRGEECQVCLDVCPLPGKAIEMREARPVIQDDRCTGCGICAFACVAAPSAIRIELRGHVA